MQHHVAIVQAPAQVHAHTSTASAQLTGLVAGALLGHCDALALGNTCKTVGAEGAALLHYSAAQITYK